jgi:Fe-S cluster biogenesis protein NfuA
MSEEQHVKRQAQEIERLIREVEAIAEPHLREKVVTLVQALMALHASGIERLMQVIADDCNGSESLLNKLASDRLVGSLLLLYGVHPLSLDTRVEQALDRLRSDPILNAGTVELLEINGQIVRLRLPQDKHHCHSSQQQLRTAIEEALYEAAPDLDEIQYIGDVQQPSISFVPLVSIRGKNGFTRTLNRSLPKP